MHAIALWTLLLLAGYGFAAEDGAKPRPKQQNTEVDPNWRARLQEEMTGSDAYVFKTVDDAMLQLFVFRPEGCKPTDKRPAIVFFFGGGWSRGTPAQFLHHCRYLASRGMVAISAEYRVRSRHGVKVPQCVADAKSAMRWVRANAAKLGIDPERIVSGGGSAGGHLGACVGVVPGRDEPGEDTSISAHPAAMVLFNPAVATAPIKNDAEDASARYKDLVGDDPKAISPYHHIAEGQAPMIMFFGTEDHLLESARLFQKAYVAKGNRCQLKTWEGVGHAFFNFGRSGNKYFIETCREMDRFLVSMGYLKGKPTIEWYVEAIDKKP